MEELSPGQPEESRILKVAHDFELFLSKGFAPYDAYLAMSRDGKSYDPLVLDALELLITEDGGYALKYVFFNELEEGMILDEDIYDDSGVLLINKNILLDKVIVDVLKKSESKVSSDRLYPVMMPSSCVVIDLNEFKSYIFSIVKSFKTYKSIDFEFTISDDMPKTLIGCDFYIRQILFNLVSNSFKFSRTGLISVHVDKILSAEFPEIVKLFFVVKDNGPGIPAKLIEGLFSPKDKEKNHVNTVNPPKSGLYNAQRLVSAMNGSFCIDSVVDCGTHIYFTCDAKTSI